MATVNSAADTELDRVYTPAEIAQRFKVSRSLIYSEIKKKHLDALWIGRLPRCTERQIQAWLSR